MLRSENLVTELPLLWPFNALLQRERPILVSDFTLSNVFACCCEPEGEFHCNSRGFRCLSCFCKLVASQLWRALLVITIFSFLHATTSLKADGAVISMDPSLIYTYNGSWLSGWLCISRVAYPFLLHPDLLYLIHFHFWHTRARTCADTR